MRSGYLMTANIFETQPTRVKAIIALAGIAVGGAIVAGIANYTYTQHRLEQCARLVDGIDRGHSTILAFRGEDAAAHSQLADRLRAVAVDLDELDLSDRRLQAYRSEFASTYRYFAAKYDSIGDILTEVNEVQPNLAGLRTIEDYRQKMANTAHNIEDRAREADRLAEQVNGYCQF